MSQTVRYAPTPENERRFKYWLIPEGAMLAHLLDLYGNPEACDGARVRVLRLKSAPEGYRVTRVVYCAMRHCWAVCVWHPSFPDVPVGGEFEEVAYDVEHVTLGD